MAKYKLGDLHIKKVTVDSMDYWSVESPQGRVFETGSYKIAKAFCAWYMKTNCTECGSSACDTEENSTLPPAKS